MTLAGARPYTRRVTGNYAAACAFLLVLLAAGKADLVALARPHLANPYFTLQASAWYQHHSQHWPLQYLSGRDQAFRLAERDRAELTDTKLRARPASHEVKVDEAQEAEFARVRHAAKIASGGTA